MNILIFAVTMNIVSEFCINYLNFKCRKKRQLQTNVSHAYVVSFEYEWTLSMLIEKVFNKDSNDIQKLTSSPILLKPFADVKF